MSFETREILVGWTRTERVDSGDGSEFDAHLVLPESGRGPGVLVLQEIFGVNRYVLDVCSRLAALGMVAMAPDVFWRTQRGVVLEGHDDETVKQAMALGKRLDIDVAARDMARALDHLRSLPETTDRAGVIGFCLGGTLAFLVATRADPDVCISYYGAGVPGLAGELDDVTCPTIFLFGGEDPVIPRKRLEPFAAAAAGRPHITVQILDGAGHAFDNHTSDAMYQAAPAKAAWAETVAALERSLY